MASDKDGNLGNWRGGLLVVAAIFTGISIYQISQIGEHGSGAVFGAVFFGACGLLAFLRARRHA